ncbi:MAG: tRNA pseudouridine(55) synthase TruB [Nitrospirae bacterium]|nr:MAG: tRNA pseudouridine(55) synthase TruB [Nitrospirota bacterium]
MNIVVVLNKPAGITSHDAVQAVKKAFKVRKAGHAGTLDPIATGVLLVCLNEATKITGYLSDMDKGYLMTIKLGENTDTYDSEGAVISTVKDYSVTKEKIERVLGNFMGEIDQIPPMYSAIKLSGKPLYELARKGIEVERKPRRIRIDRLELVSYNDPFVTLSVECSKGTYVRSLCNDIGAALATGAHVTGLVRTRIGRFRVEDSALINELPQKTDCIYTIDNALAGFTEALLDGDNFRRAKNGNPIKIINLLNDYRRALIDLITPEGRDIYVRLKDLKGNLFGIGKVVKDSIKIERLFN